MTKTHQFRINIYMIFFKVNSAVKAVQSIPVRRIRFNHSDNCFEEKLRKTMLRHALSDGSCFCMPLFIPHITPKKNRFFFETIPLLFD